MKLLADFIMRGRLQAILLAAATAMLSFMFAPLSVVSSAVIALVTLRLGGKEGLLILAAASLAAVVMTLVLPVNALAVPLYAALIWLPVWLIAIVLREGRHFSLAVEIAVLLGIVGVVGYYLYTSDPASLWRQVLPRMMPPSAPPEKVRQVLEVLPLYMTGIAAAGSVLGILLGLLLGRWWQALLYNPGGFRKEFLSLSAQPRIAVAGLAIIVLAFAGFGKLSETAWNIAVLFLVFYSLIGIAVLHTLFSKMNIANLAIPMFYITLVLIPHTAVPLVSLVGLADTWLNLRKTVLKQT